MAMGSNGLDRPQSSINVTPLVDVLLVLLIIFMVVTPILAKALQSQIPQAADRPIPEEYSKRQLVVRVAADGSLRLNTEAVTLATLSERLREAFATRGGDRAVFLDADDKVPYGSVVQIMDLCRGAGANTIGVLPDSIRASS